jgi:hypothetical protein
VTPRRHRDRRDPRQRALGSTAHKTRNKEEPSQTLGKGYRRYSSGT